MDDERIKRASQFIPFAALRGYYDMVSQIERVPGEKHEATEEEILEISNVLRQLKKGDIVRVTYYDKDAYVTIIGAVVEVVEVYKYLQVKKTKISFDDILDITIEH
ncbi:MAG: YolD-like family protein [Coriobacteriales bacterium]|nr:YolD-like family protein [Coriobacteriales bacterium]